MGRTRKRLFVVVILFILALFQTMTGMIMWFAFPENDVNGHDAIETTFWSLSHHDWATPHQWAAIALVAVIIIHLFINWKWLVNAIRGLWKPTGGNGPL